MGKLLLLLFLLFVVVVVVVVAVIFVLVNNHLLILKCSIQSDSEIVFYFLFISFLMRFMNCS